MFIHGLATVTALELYNHFQGPVASRIMFFWYTFSDAIVPGNPDGDNGCEVFFAQFGVGRYLQWPRRSGWCALDNWIGPSVAVDAPLASCEGWASTSLSTNLHTSSTIDTTSIVLQKTFWLKSCIGDRLDLEGLSRLTIGSCRATTWSDTFAQRLFTMFNTTVVTLLLQFRWIVIDASSKVVPAVISICACGVLFQLVRRLLNIASSSAFVTTLKLANTGSSSLLSLGDHWTTV